MADNRRNVGERDRSRVSGSEGYGIKYFAEKHGITADDVRDPVRKHGNDRDTLDRAAAEFAAR